MAKRFVKPTLDQVRDYASSRGCPHFDAQKFIDYYEAGDWKDSTGKSVRNWKQKFIAVWESKALAEEKKLNGSRLPWPRMGWKKCCKCGIAADFEVVLDYDHAYCRWCHPNEWQRRFPGVEMGDKPSNGD